MAQAPAARRDTDWPEVWRHERGRIARRRAALDLPPLPDDEAAGAPASASIGLALSGGGVRSATFSLGLMQGLSRHRLLESFDYLSTVSGGGYIGAFFCSLFNSRDGHAPVPPSAPYEVLRGASSKPDAVDPRATGWQLWWLRNSGAYLAPTGAGDYLYAVAMALRNLVAVHYVIGVAVLLSLLALMAADGVLRQAAQALGIAWSMRDPGLGLLTWAGLCGALWLVPAALAYFATEMPSPLRSARGRALWWLNGTAGVMALLGLGGGAVAVLAQQRGLPPLLWAGAAAFGGVVFLALLQYVAAALLVQQGHYVPGGRAERSAATPQGRMLSTRVALTKWLATALKATLLTGACAAVLGFGTVVTTLMAEHPQQGPFAWGAVSLLLVGAVKKGATWWSRLSVPDWLRTLPLDVLALAGAFVLAALLLLGWCGVVWSALSLLGVRWATLGWPFEAAFVQLVGGVLVLNLATAYCFQFVNLSSIQNLYASRLVRAYLGASNPVRAHLNASRWTRLSDTHPQDNLSLAQYYDAALHPPLHVVNVTLNETVSPLDPLVQRDRHGRPLALSPDHLCIDGTWHPRHEPQRGAAALPPGRPPETLSIGSWIGISGAAFSTGIGRGTSLGKALMLGLANVRLGHWWRAGALQSPVPAASPGRGVLGWGAYGLARLFQPQAYLLAELLGRFRGSFARYWYLSDGGHFENTALYELLRRRVGLVIASDNGADPDYQHDDLANLMRLARLDFGCEFLRLDAPALQAAGGDAAALAPLLIDAGSGRGQGTDGRCVSVFWACRPGEPLAHGTALVVVKPRLVQHAPLDVGQYAQAHPRFPQEPTTDQFFSEEQWESYRKLGETIGTTLFTAQATAPGERLPALRAALLRAAHAVAGMSAG